MKPDNLNRVLPLSVTNVFLAATEAKFPTLPRFGRVSNDGTTIRTLTKSMPVSGLRVDGELKPKQRVVIFTDIG